MSVCSCRRRVVVVFVMMLGAIFSVNFAGHTSVVKASTHNSPSPQQSTAPDLFGSPDAGEDQPPDLRDDFAVTRYRWVSVDFDLLDSALAGDGGNAVSSVQLNLFNDTAVEAILERVEPNESGGYAWIGTVKDVAHSQVIIVVRQGRATASVRMPQGLFQIFPEGGSLHSIRELDEAQFESDGDDTIEVPRPGFSASVQAASAVSSDDGSIVDVMVVYGSNARAAVGGTAAMLDRIALGMTESNMTLSNSGASFQYRLVHTYETTYTSSGSASTDLSRLRFTSDGYMDDIHALRDTYGADMVSLWLNEGGCGYGYLWSTAATAFSVARLDCATGNLTFGHEFGHNFGARHDWFVDDTNESPTTYNHGRTNPAGQWRTMMAYNTNCNALSVYCTRVTQISNPAVSYSNAPTGFAAGTETNCTAYDTNNPDCDADNVRLMNERVVTVANFRQRQVPYAVTQIGPLNSTSSLSPTFEWKPDEIANEYKVAIFDETNNAVVFFNDGTPYSASVVCTGSDPASDTCSVQPSVTLSSGVTYRWLVLAIYNSISGPWSIYP